MLHGFDKQQYLLLALIQLFTLSELSQAASWATLMLPEEDTHADLLLKATF